jgi:hypothetical protein
LGLELRLGGEAGFRIGMASPRRAPTASASMRGHYSTNGLYSLLR